ncbi:hypothetical protein [Streptomyces sp. NPDC090080]|uniref:hypothetical protein n=1 Tax=Streptomyces sp. NPDC090080 TaxID=3365939 RepID=UPI0038102E4B
MRSLNEAFLTARYEWQTACTVWDRLRNASEIRSAPTAFSFFDDAVDEIANGVTAYERRVALTTWRYAAAAIVLGVTVLQRVAQAK